ncbi:GNAT family N-acetyltransferase [Streptomyces sp. NPDC058374]|uniref:GNAT family N-acetyltransferase n=1 Tax=Streptomyces sp. NPDC058374 TaxID=3346466 RepID=UPI003649B797
MIPRSYLAAMSAERDAELRVRRFAAGRAAGLRNLVAVDAAGEVVGWACCGPREAGGGGAGGREEGELYALYVRPELLGRGIGRALLDAVHGEAAARAGALGDRGQPPRPALLRGVRVPGGRGRPERGVRRGGGAGGAVPAGGGAAACG